VTVREVGSIKVAMLRRDAALRLFYREKRLPTEVANETSRQQSGLSKASGEAV